jgi:hypothetical protein
LFSRIRLLFVILSEAINRGLTVIKITFYQYTTPRETVIDDDGVTGNRILRQ